MRGIMLAVGPCPLEAPSLMEKDNNEINTYTCGSSQLESREFRNTRRARGKEGRTGETRSSQRGQEMLGTMGALTQLEGQRRFLS